MMSGVAIGAVVMPPAAEYLIGRIGWQLTYSVAGIGVLVIAVPVAVALLKDRPEEAGMLPDGIGFIVRPAPRAHRQENPGMSWSDTWRSRTFWLLLLSLILISASVQGCVTQIAAILADHGSPARTGALASSVVGIGLLIARIGSGYLFDHFFAPRVAALIFIAAALGMALLCLGNSQHLAFAAAFFIGSALGAEGDIVPYLTGRYFGLRSFGKICGAVWTGSAVAGGLGAWLMGAAFDVYRSYSLPLVFFCMVALAAAVLILTLGPYPFAAALVMKGGPQQATVSSEP
jgi:predicted MFS family arabinose efflux permease